jgi:hypothetical protein
MLPLKVLIRNIYWNIPFWLSEAEAWLSSDGLKIYTDGSLFKGKAGSGVFLEELDLNASFAIGMFAAVF